jgi:hypothetical protein
MTARAWVMLTAVIVLGIGSLATTGNAADDGAKVAREVVTKMATALEQGKEDDAKKLAAQLKNVDLDDIMNLMLPRKGEGKGGLGIGPKPGGKNDGIEKKVRDLKKNAPTAAEMADLEKAGYIMKAIAIAARDKVPMGKDRKKWPEFNTNYEKVVQEFIEAAKKKDAAAVKKIADKLDATCVTCHNAYKPT